MPVRFDDDRAVTLLNSTRALGQKLVEASGDASRLMQGGIRVTIQAAIDDAFRTLDISYQLVSSTLEAVRNGISADFVVIPLSGRSIEQQLSAPVPSGAGSVPSLVASTALGDEAERVWNIAQGLPVGTRSLTEQERQFLATFDGDHFPTDPNVDVSTIPVEARAFLADLYRFREKGGHHPLSGISAQLANSPTYVPGVSFGPTVHQPQPPRADDLSADGPGGSVIRRESRVGTGPTYMDPDVYALLVSDQIVASAPGSHNINTDKNWNGIMDLVESDPFSFALEPEDVSEPAPAASPAAVVPLTAIQSEQARALSDQIVSDVGRSALNINSDANLNGILDIVENNFGEFAAGATPLADNGIGFRTVTLLDATQPYVAPSDGLLEVGPLPAAFPVASAPSSTVPVSPAILDSLLVDEITQPLGPVGVGVQNSASGLFAPFGQQAPASLGNERPTLLNFEDFWVTP
jgi:hypothetical protein